ncbi:hypothetical protein [Streptomyces mirabilis]|uniref:hypothetical protein n=1 Tax=Streptomyces mirabilis TaxID=68239 RepID=UPI003652BDA2
MDELVEVRGDRLEEPPPRVRVHPDRGRGALHVSGQQARPSVVEVVREVILGPPPFQAETVQSKGRQEGRDDAGGVERREFIV